MITLEVADAAGHGQSRSSSGRRPMISMSKPGVIALVAAIGIASPLTALGVASPAFAQSIYSPSETGGGSWGYNHHMAIDQWRLRHHLGAHARGHHLPSKTQ
jgi:hypothetical protein